MRYDFARAAVVAILIVLMVATSTLGQPIATPESSSKISALIQQLQDPSPERRKNAAIALMAIKPLPPEALNPMLAAVAFPYLEVRKAIADAGGMPVADLTAALHSKDSNSQVGAEWLLGDMASTIPRYGRSCSKRSAATIARCAMSPRNNFRMPRTPMRKCWCGSFATCSRTRNPQIRLAAVEALSGLGPRAKDATPDIAAMLKDSAKDNRSMAIEALRSIGPPAAPAISSRC